MLYFPSFSFFMPLKKRKIRKESMIGYNLLYFLKCQIVYSSITSTDMFKFNDG